MSPPLCFLFLCCRVLQCKVRAPISKTGYFRKQFRSAPTRTREFGLAAAASRRLALYLQADVLCWLHHQILALEARAEI